MTEKAELRDGLPPPRLYALSSEVGSQPPPTPGKTVPLSAQVKELTKELRAQLNETQKLLDRTRIR
jgi:hypothetical protein